MTPPLRPDRARSQNRRSAILRLVGIVALIFVASVLGLLRYMGVFGGNIRTVESHRVYRSAQLVGSTLAHELEADHIRTIINLRGREADDPWYRDETARCRSLGVDHVDVAFSATHLPPPDQLDTLVKALDTAQYPILIHCMGGADRSGLAATLYLVLEKHWTVDRAETQQLTWRYGHLSFSKAHAMDDFFDLYRAQGGGLDMRRWIATRYPALYKQQYH